MMVCAGCGAELPDDAAFCPKCGSPNPDHARSAPPAVGQEHVGAPARNRTRIIAAVAGLGILLAGAGIAWFLLHGRTAQGALVSLTSREPIAGAGIQYASGVAKTDTAGRFVLPRLRLGTHDVTVTVPGFAPFAAALRVRAAGATKVEIALPDASVIVHVEEIALQGKAVESASVRVGGVEASRTATGRYEIKGLRPGAAAIKVTGPSHESTETSVTLKPGENEVEVGVSLTPAETYSRYFQTYKSQQWSAAYVYLHPDVAKRESLAAYTKHMKDWGKPVSITLDSTRMLPRWTSPYTQMSYTNVAEIHRTLVTEKQGGRFSSALPQHWVKVDGLWLRIDI